MQEIITKIQDKVISFLQEACGHTDKPLSYLCEDSCSEISRLTAFWLSQELPEAKFLILKGERVQREKSHDILAVSYLDKIFLVDTAIWQFFPSHKSSYLGEFINLDKVFVFLKKFYGGKWQVSEKLTNESFKERDEWKKIIYLNLNSQRGQIAKGEPKGSGTFDF